MDCPLPIDWLDWIDERADQVLTEHLEQCVSCQAVVALLRSDDTEVRAEMETPPAARPSFMLDESSGAPSAGELWVTSPADADLDCALVLVLDDRHSEFDRDWYEIAAVDTATERATEFDLLLEPADTDTNLPLRVRFELQGYVAKFDLRSRVGALTTAGRSVLAAAVGGVVDESRWGFPIEGPHDQRLVELDHGDAVVRQLQVLYRARDAAAQDAELTFAAVIKQARIGHDLTRAELAERLAHRLGLVSLGAKIKRYYADLEHGRLSPAYLRPSLINALARTLGIPWQQLEGVRGAWQAPAATAGSTVFARSASQTAMPVADAAEGRWDAVDDLFLGGGDS